MQKIDALVAVAGWEDRFALGVEKDIRENVPREVIVVVFEEYAQQTQSNRTQVENCCLSLGVKYVEIGAKRSTPADVWNRLHHEFAAPRFNEQAVLVDITTMPREVIWWCFQALQTSGALVSYIYYKPGEYAPGWVTRDTERPRLVYQSSGVSEFGRDTCLVLVSGFDIDRAAQMIQFFEPAVTLVALQAGEQFRNQSENVARHKLALRSSAKISYCDVDAYSPDHGAASIEKAIEDLRSNYNLILASLGPKLSAVALYLLHQNDSTLALAYAPSRQFNPDYSRGIGEAVRGKLNSIGR